MPCFKGNISRTSNQQTNSLGLFESKKKNCIIFYFELLRMSGRELKFIGIKFHSIQGDLRGLKFFFNPLSEG